MEMIKTLGYNKYLVQINYKSGISMKFWVYSFAMSGNSVEWHPVDHNHPIAIGLDDIESAWKLKAKKGLLGKKSDD